MLKNVKSLNLNDRGRLLGVELMTETTNEEKYYLNMGVVAGSIITYFCLDYLPSLAWITIWVCAFGYAVYQALK